MSPLPGWRVVPEGWAEHHRPTVNATMTTDAVFVRTNGPAPYPKPPNWVATSELWRTRVRVQALNNAPRQADAAEQTVTVRRYLVAAPLDGAPDLKVGQGADQVLVLGRRLRIVDITPGSLLWEMDLICEENLTQAGPVDLTPEGGADADRKR